MDMVSSPCQIVLPFSDREFGWVSQNAENIIIALCAIGVLFW